MEKYYNTTYSHTYTYDSVFTIVDCKTYTYNTNSFWCNETEMKKKTISINEIFVWEDASYQCNIMDIILSV